LAGRIVDHHWILLSSSRCCIFQRRHFLFDLQLFVGQGERQFAEQGESMIRAKFRVMSIIEHADNASARTIKMMPYYDDSIPEDRRFSQATPSGELSMYVNNPAAIAELRIGRQFYLDFVPVDEVKS
jgi:hypothetical protein